MANESNHQKDELLENISEIFLTYGLRSTSMDDICTHLKISKKTLYQLFTNKDDVVKQVMIYRRKKRREETNMSELFKTNPIRFLYNIKNHIIKDLSSRLPANYFDIKKYHPELEKEMCEEEAKFIKEMLSTILNNGVKEGYFLKEADMKVQIHLFSKQLSFLGDPETMNIIEYPIPVIISTIVDNFIRGISTLKGIEEFEEISEEEKKRKI